MYALISRGYKAGGFNPSLARALGPGDELGPEAIARAVKGPIFYVAVERTRRGHYRVELEPLVGHDGPIIWFLPTLDGDRLATIGIDQRAAVEHLLS